jgi:hypothetical protein
MSEREILRAITNRNQTLYVSESGEPGSRVLYCLDCDMDSFGKQFIELPRFYGTERGARAAAARLVDEKLVWVKP